MVVVVRTAAQMGQSPVGYRRWAAQTCAGTRTRGSSSFFTRPCGRAVKLFLLRVLPWLPRGFLLIGIRLYYITMLAREEGSYYSNPLWGYLNTDSTAITKIAMVTVSAVEDVLGPGFFKQPRRVASSVSGPLPYSVGTLLRT